MGASGAASPHPLRSWRHHAGATLQLGLPLVGAQLAQTIIYTTDTIMIGWLGAPELAASVLGSQAAFIVLMFGSGFAFAIMPMIAQAIGAGDETTARRAARMGLWIVAGYSAVMMVPLWFIEPILLALGQDGDLAAMARDYMRFLQWSLFPALFVMVVRNLLSAMELARIVLIATVAAAIVNAVVNYCLIFGNFGFPRLELQGAAIASFVSAMLALTILVAYCMWKPAVARLQLHVRLWRADWPALREVVGLGWPISLTIIAEVGLFIGSSLLMGWIGVIELAAHGIALQLASLVFMIPLGLSSAATVRVGLAAGRRDTANLRRAIVTVLCIAVLVSGIGAFLFVVLPDPLVAMFLDADNANAAEVAAYAVPLLAVAAAFQLADSIQAVAAGLLRGIKDMRVPMLLAVLSYWVVGMPAAWLLAFPLAMGGVGVWLGLACGLALAAVLLTARLYRSVWPGEPVFSRA